MTNMLDVKLPFQTENSIDLGAITSKFNGILILYIAGKCVGYISYNNDNSEWLLHTDISEDVSNAIFDSCSICENLIDLINIIKNKYTHSIEVKAIPFTNITTI